MTGVRFLGMCGLAAAALSAAAGFLNAPLLLAASGLVMVLGNLLAIFTRRTT